MIHDDRDRPDAVGPVSAEVRELIERLRLAYVATASADGEPNVSPKGSLKVLDVNHVAFADIASPRTVANLRENPRLEINVVDPFARRGFRIRGTAEVLDDPELIAVVGAGLGADYPVEHAVVITVTDVRPVDSPVYLFTDADPAAVNENWQSIYGYRKVD
jgi:predicted pyridoxine 5'-phosphate oxidase superfamily flavin-nucleotide-binding protein